MMRKETLPKTSANEPAIQEMMLHRFFQYEFRKHHAKQFVCRCFVVLLLGVWVCDMATSDCLGQQDTEAGIAVHAKSSPSRCWLANPTPNVLQKWLPLELSAIEGEILEINRDEIVYVADGETQMRKVPGDQVVAIDVDWGSEEAKVAHEAYLNRDYAKSFELARKAISSGILRWQQRIMVSEMVTSSRLQGRWSTSGKVFLTLAAQSPPTIHFATIPLIWEQQELDRSALDLAKEWMTKEEEEARLIAASWLLSGSARGQAAQVLEELSRSRRPEISKLATAQLWRLVPAAEVASQRYPEWSNGRNAMPLPLQLGPTQLIADKLDQAGKTELAIPEWMRIATLHSDRYDAVEAAVEKATKAFNKLGRPEEAKKLTRMLRNGPGREQPSAE